MTIRRQLLTTILLAGIPLLALQAYTIIQHYKSEKHLVLEREMETAQTTASLLEVGVGHLVEHHQMVGRFIAYNPDRTTEALAWVRKSSPLVVRSSYFRPDGRAVLDAARTRDTPPKSIFDRPYFQALLQGKDWVVSDLLISRARGNPKMVLAIAVRNNRRVLKGVLTSAIKPEAFASLLHFEAQEGAYFGIVDGNGRLIASNLPQDLSWEKRDWSKEAGVQKALAGMPTTVERFIHPLEGTFLMGAWAPVPALGWAVGVMGEMEHEMKPVKRAGIIQLGSLAFVFLLSLILALMLAGRLSGPIIGLAETARKFGDGDLSQRVEVKGGDEVNILAKAFNKMGEDLASSQAALRRQTDELKRKASELQVLYELSRQLDSTLEREDVLELALVKVKELVGSDLALISIFDEGSGRLIFRTHPELPQESLQAVVSFLAEKWSSPKAGKREELLLVDRLSQQDGLSLLASVLGGIESLIDVPLKAKGRAIGTITLTSTKAGRFTKQDIAFLSSVASVVAVAIDNARLYAQTKKDAEAKALLIRELDHRVRNNLATIVGLLSMELGRKGHWAAEDALKACIDRVQSLATIHNLLAQNDFKELDLKMLVEGMAKAAVKGFSWEKNVEIAVDAPPLRLPPNLLAAFALAANELITNALKHAFRCRDAGRIEVEVREEGEAIELEVRDDGVGVPAAVAEGSRKGVGLDIVASLVRTDLRGEFQLHSNRGTVATIRFPKPRGAEVDADHAEA